MGTILVTIIHVNTHEIELAMAHRLPLGYQANSN